MSPYVGAIAAAFFSSALWPALLPKLIEWKNRKQEQERQNREDEREMWFRESAQAFKRVKRECDVLDARWHLLIDGLDDMCSESANGVVTVAEIRTLVRKARRYEQQQQAEPWQ